MSLKSTKRYQVGLSRGYCVYDRVTKTFGPQLRNKRVTIAEVKRLNSARATIDS